MRVLRRVVLLLSFCSSSRSRRSCSRRARISRTPTSRSTPPGPRRWNRSTRATPSSARPMRRCARVPDRPAPSRRTSTPRSSAGSRRARTTTGPTRSRPPTSWKGWVGGSSSSSTNSPTLAGDPAVKGPTDAFATAALPGRAHRVHERGAGLPGRAPGTGHGVVADIFGLRRRCPDPSTLPGCHVACTPSAPA